MEEERAKIWANGAGGAGPDKEAATGGKTALTHTDNKWDKIGKDIENQEKMEEARDKDYH